MKERKKKTRHIFSTSAHLLLWLPGTGEFVFFSRGRNILRDRYGPIMGSLNKPCVWYGARFYIDERAFQRKSRKYRFTASFYEPFCERFRNVISLESVRAGARLSQQLPDDLGTTCCPAMPCHVVFWECSLFPDDYRTLMGFQLRTLCGKI